MITTAEHRQTPRPTRSQGINFSDGHREAHLHAFYSWLPSDLHDAPGICWAHASSRLLGYCVKTVGESPDKGYVAFAIGTAIGGLGQASLHQYLSRFYQLLCLLRKVCGIQHLSELRNKEVWEDFAQKTAVTLHRYHLLRAYAALGEKHVRFYLEHLASHAQRDHLSVYALPPLPPRFMERHGAEQMVVGQSQQRRRERCDILVPLYHVLVALIQLRKQAAQRMILAFREACQRAKAGERLPLRFAYEERLPLVNRSAQTVADVRIDGRSVIMRFLLWNRRSWTLGHRECFSTTTVRDAERREGSYRPEAEEYFLQFDGEPCDLLWFGDLVRERLLQKLDLNGPADAQYQARLAYAHTVGASQGFTCSRPGLLTPSREEGFWLTRVSFSWQPGEMVFAPEQLYRGCLYGAALATIALTNGSRVNELLQVSLDRRKTRTETVTVTKERRAEQRRTTLHLQHLLPKGARTDEERQYFLLSPQSVTLLGEILQLLIKEHGQVPLVHPPIAGSKSEYLKPERYLFQWAASSDGHTGMLDIKDTVILLRFLLHGLELFTVQGEPIKVTTHLLRHVTATVMREEAVPVEAIQWTLHHQPERAPFEGASLSAATEYYTRMPEEKRLQSVHRFHLSVEGQESAMEIAVPDECRLAKMDEKLRAVFDRWGTINPTNFGYCGRTGLCPRGNYRALCIGCPYLVPDPAKLEEALHWERLYRELADHLRATGSSRDAQQAEAQARDLRDLIAMMRLSQQAEADRQFVPFYRNLPMSKKEGQHRV
jgi:hypothetical protein